MDYWPFHWQGLIKTWFTCSVVLFALNLQERGLKLIEEGWRRLERGGFERHLNSLSAILSFNHPMISFLWSSDRTLNTSPNIFMLEREKQTNKQINVHANKEQIFAYLLNHSRRRKVSKKGWTYISSRLEISKMGGSRSLDGGIVSKKGLAVHKSFIRLFLLRSVPFCMMANQERGARNARMKQRLPSWYECLKRKRKWETEYVVCEHFIPVSYEIG